jgi:YcxB-like protein
MFSLKYNVTKQDYADFFVYNFWDNPVKRKKRIQQLVKQTGIWLFIVAAFGYMFWKKGSSNSYIFIAIAIFSSFSIISAFFGKNALINQAENIAENPANEIFFAEQELIINDAGIQIKHTFGEEKYHWNAIVKKAETNEHYFLYKNALQAFIIPKRLIKTSAEKQILDKLLTKHLLLNAEIGDD